MLKKWPFILMTLTMVFALAACGSGNNAAPQGDAAAGTDNKAAAELTGNILAVGSTALQPLVEQAGQKFMAVDKYKGIAVQVQGGGSGTGLTQVSGGQADIGNSDVFAKEKLESGAEELVDHQVAVVAMSAVANPKVGVTDLKKDQLVQIFTGKITNWKEVGGADQKIVIVNRPSSSGTRATFEKYALGQKTEDLPGSIQEDSSGTVKKLIAETPGAIGYLALSYIDNTVTALKYDGVEANVENVEQGKYPVWAYEHMYTKGEPKEHVKAFLDYILSDEIQKADVVDLGYIPVSGMQVKRDADGNITK
ncbi:phosphate ABC transporter substrate-binding protein PstS family protein [Paenibacillus polymyxa]|jgi:phosphate transport system substrate-binding protein|uniref:Phosphate-binding protein n=1 Tax=Paenibacillus polymyxa TaxID=1406 RepID=A0A0F0G8V5_PAEPO|nr:MULTISPECIES: phosphate ABC transporter substrate-binding protein [Paenibacillus]AHM65318.1 phosphate ABC transporter permease [Paenibacillus polymyxa SQR-21]AIY10842.1 phosphate-binding protein [Paenibacillus polymyxa]AUS25876.1 phosphate-binding protein [Paenibacillus polymyxa]KAE8558350.1 phosphate-binding protein [Paenibacillus polymyxa]KAF6582132.1 phosphate ABC transporter substrate-binding protein [Paenibacillus sp. EKM211P]